jgi:WhiB family redox-sensing transcriptional regulator
LQLGKNLHFLPISLDESKYQRCNLTKGIPRPYKSSLLSATLTRRSLMSELTSLPFAEIDEMGWHERALCAQTDPEAFFPEKGGSTREAKRVCGSCDVRVDCLEYALSNDERFGIWGGLSERERRRLKRAQAS